MASFGDEADFVIDQLKTVHEFSDRLRVTAVKRAYKTANFLSNSFTGMVPVSGPPLTLSVQPTLVQSYAKFTRTK